MERAAADPVGKVGAVRDVPDGQFGLGPVRDFTIHPCQSERLCGVPGRAGQCLFRSQGELDTGHVHRSKKRGQGRAAWIAVGRDGYVDPMLAKGGDGRQLRFPERIEGAGQEDSHGSGAGKFRNIRL